MKKIKKSNMLDKSDKNSKLSKLSNRGAVLLTFAVVGLLMAVTVYFIYENSNQIIKDFIGYNQFELLSTAKEAEKSQFYLERASDIAAKKALFEVASSDIGCGEDLGYSKWISDGKDCYTGIQIKDKFLELFRKNFDELLSSTDISVQASNFDLSLYERKNIMDINAETPSQEIDLIWPANGYISSCYGYRQLEIKDTEFDWHDGVDIAVPEGTNVKAPGDGTVVSICKEWVDACACSITNPSCPVDCKGKCGNYGNYIIIKHNDNLYTRMSHLKDISVSEGANVKQGELIAKSGNTGLSEGPHMDFKVYFSNEFSSDVGKGLYERNPLCYLPEKPAEDFVAASCNDNDGTSVQLCPGKITETVKSGTYVRGTGNTAIISGTGKVFTGAKVTHYYAPLVDESKVWSTGENPASYPNYDIYKWCVIPESKRGIYEDIKCQGSGVTATGDVYRYDTIKTTKESSQVSKKIETATGTTATAYRTIAVSDAMIPYGSTVKITFENCKDQDCCNKWNGEYVAEDTGDAMKNDWKRGIAHIDLYVGIGKSSLEAASCLPDTATLEVISSKAVPTTSGQIIYKLKSNFNAFVPYSFSEFDLIHSQLKLISEGFSKKCINSEKRDECIYEVISAINTKGIIWTIDCDKSLFGPAKSNEVRLCAKSKYSFLSQNSEKESLIYKMSFTMPKTAQKITESATEPILAAGIAETQTEIPESVSQEISQVQVPGPVSITAQKTEGFADIFDIFITATDASITEYSFYLKQSDFCSTAVSFTESNKIMPSSMDLSLDVDKATLSIPDSRKKYCLLVVAENSASASEPLTSSRYDADSFALLKSP